MQKAYSRINWENAPSENTPLGANNLNKVDMALNTIDDRVLSLYGYESRVAASEKNAKTSETNAKESELLAKEYMEKSFSGTPEGYEKLVDDVRLMDIKQTTETTLYNSKQGGLKLVSISGASVQNGTPTPDEPVAIHNVGDCLELQSGCYLTSNGQYNADSAFMCSKNPVPCTSGDIIKFAFEKASVSYVLFYNENGFVSYSQSGSTHEYTVPSGVTHFKFDVYQGGAILTSDTVGKISLTIKGKYVVQKKTENKNLWTFGDQSFTKSVLQNVDLPSGTYTVSAMVTSSGTDSNISRVYFYDDANNSYYVGLARNERASGTVTIPNRIKQIVLYAEVSNATSTDDTATYYNVQLERGEVMTDYEEHKETVATVLLNEPLRGSDVMSSTEVVRKRAKSVFVGADGEAIGVNASGKLYFVIPNIDNDNPNILCNRLGASDVTVFNSNIITNITDFATVDEAKTWIESNSIEFEYNLAMPTTEELDNDSKIALNSLETFNTVTYINVDSRVQTSEIVSEYGTSKVGGYTLKSLLNSESNAIKLNELATAIVAVGSEV